MNTPGFGTRLLALWLALGGVGGGMAQTVTYLSPARSKAKVGETVAVRTDQRTKDATRQADWPADDVRWMLVRSGPKQTNMDVARPTRAGEQTVDVELEYPGVTLIAMDVERPVKLERVEDLRAFGTRLLADELPAELARLSDATTVRVRRLESMKTLVRVMGDAETRRGNSAVALGKTGQRAEIRLLNDPTMAKVGTDVVVKGYVESSSTSGAKITATHVESGKQQTFAAKRGGDGYFTLTEAGAWRVELHKLVPAKDKQADWLLYSATLTFEVPELGEES